MIPNLHDPDYWLEELEPLLRELDFAFQVAIPKAHKFFTDYHKKPVNRPLLSNLIRYHALEYLWSKGYNDAKEEGDDPDGWGLRGLPNNGIELLYKQSCIRVRKGIEPPCPMTAAAKNFYQQRLFAEAIAGVVTNLLVLYSLSADLQYGGMQLMRPVKLLRGKNGSPKVKCDWSQTVVFGATVDLNKPIPVKYSLNPDLPLSAEEKKPEAENIDKTGTDDISDDADKR